MALFTAFGDSITFGDGASPASKSYVGQFSPINNGVSGAQAAEVSRKIHGTGYPSPAAPLVIDTSEAYTIMIGTNDHRIYKNDANKQEYFKKFLRASLAYLAFPVKTLADGAVTYTGVWSGSNSTYGRKTTAANATATFTFSGEFFYLTYILQNHSATTGSQIEVSVDGVLIDTITSQAASPSMNTNLGSTYAPGCIRYGGFSSGTHTVEFKNVAGGKYFYFEWAAGGIPASTPKILLSNVIRMNAVAYSTYGSSDANVNDLNTIIASLVTEINGDGGNVILVDNHASIDPSVDLADGVHPNNLGHKKIHDNFAAVLP